MRQADSRRNSPRMIMAVWAVMALCAALIVTGGATSAFADTPVAAGGKAIITNTDGDPIRIRRGAGTEFAQIATGYEGQAVSVLEGPVTDKASIRWFKIEAPGGTGWMMAEFLRGTSPPPGPPKLTGSAVVANTNGDPLRMRSAPNAAGNVLTLLNPGAAVTIQDGPVTDSAD